MPWSARPAPFSSIGRREDDRPAVQSISSARRTLSMSEVRIRNRLCCAGAATVRRSSSKWACRSRGSRSSSLFLRSEEHTSELQSQSNLVCRLLLEKKKKDNRYVPEHE